MRPGKASSTARLIALATVMRPNDAPSGAARWCERLLAGDALLPTVRTRWGKAFWRGVERAVLPGMVNHWLRRKLEIDDLAHRAALDGFTQLLVLGGGLDTLAWRMAKAGTFERVLSADHPATLAAVERAIPPPRGVELSAIDLADGIPANVLGALEPGRSTLVVIEGVLMYLREQAVEQLLSRLAALPTPRVRIIASWMVERPGKPVGFSNQSRLVHPWLARRGEPMLWGTTPERLAAVLEGAGFERHEWVALDGPAEGGRPVGLPDERLVVAAR